MVSYHFSKGVAVKEGWQTVKRDRLHAFHYVRDGAMICHMIKFVEGDLVPDVPDNRHDDWCRVCGYLLDKERGVRFDKFHNKVGGA
jgi:hypothetical protein